MAGKKKGKNRDMRKMGNAQRRKLMQKHRGYQPWTGDARTMSDEQRYRTRAKHRGEGMPEGTILNKAEKEKRRLRKGGEDPRLPPRWPPTSEHRNLKKMPYNYKKKGSKKKYYDPKSRMGRGRGKHNEGSMTLPLKPGTGIKERIKERQKGRGYRA